MGTAAKLRQLQTLSFYRSYVVLASSYISKLPSKRLATGRGKKFAEEEEEEEEASDFSGDHHRHVDAEFISVFGKQIAKRGLQMHFTITMAVLLSVANKVLYKMALIPMSKYPFFLAQITTLGYVIVYSMIIFVRYWIGVVTKEMFAIAPKSIFIAVGALEALGLVSGMAAATNLPGASIPVLTQVYLVWQLLLSVTFLQKRYSWGQIIGCLLVILGVVVVVMSGSGRDSGGGAAASKVFNQNSGSFFWSLVIIFSTAFFAAASILKEFAFQDARRQHQKMKGGRGGSIDIFIVNAFGSLFQAFFVLLLSPLLSNLQGISFKEQPKYLSSAAACLANSAGSSQNGCDGAPLVPLLYILVNMAFNISNLSLLKQSSAVVSSLCVTLAVPLSIWAFTLPLPLFASSATLPPGVYEGASILIAGLAFFNLLKPNSKKGILK